MIARRHLALGVAAAALVAVPLGLTSGGGSIDVFVGSTPTPTASTTITCNQTAANAAGLTSALSAASNGQTICLTAAVDYGTFNGTSKTVTIISQSGTGAPNPVANSIDLSFGSGDSGFTIDGNMTSWSCACGLTITDAYILGGASRAHDITLKNFRGTGSGGGRYINFAGNEAPGGGTQAGANITIDHAYLHDYVNGEAIIFIFTDDGSTVDTGIVVKNTLFKHSSPDAVKLSGPTKATIRNNKIIDFRDSYGTDGNHTDGIQLNSGSGSTISGNWVIDADACIPGYDGQNSATITHNVTVNCSTDSITLQADSPASTISYNTVALTDFQAANPDGRIFCGTNLTKPNVTSVTNVYNNYSYGGIELVGSQRTCAPTRNDHNVSGSQSFVGGTTSQMDSFTSFADYCPAVGSSMNTAADDGGKVGVCGGDYNGSNYGPPAG